MKNTAVIKHFQRQADACRKMASEFTANLCEQLIDVVDCQTKTGSLIENWPGDPAADALALRLCGGLHSIVISNPSDTLAAIYPDDANTRNNPDFSKILSEAIRTHDDELIQWLGFAPQTNETGRAAALLPGLLKISRQCKLPLHLCEIGASAGLNLQLDRFYYEYADTSWGNPNSPVKLNPVMKAVQPDLTGELKITSRIGCDLSPLDIVDENQQLRLRSYIWPDQKYRSDRLNGAIELAIETPPKLMEIDAAEFIELQLADRPQNTAFVLMHSVVWQYLPQYTKDRIERSLHLHGAKATATNPVYWLRLEGLGGKEPAASLLLDSWPNHSQAKLANSCYHGSWIEFL